MRGISYVDAHPKGGAGYQRDVPKPFKAILRRNRWRDYHPEASYKEVQT
jgi:hypothetical protein